MIKDEDKETLDLHKQHIDGRQKQLIDAIDERDDFIRKLLGSGAKPNEVAMIVGLSRGRVHQIRGPVRKT